jgi:hypothetical protein
MSIILPARNVIKLLGDIKQGVNKEVNVSTTGLAQETTLQSVDATLGNIDTNTTGLAQETTLSQLVAKTMPRTAVDAFGRQRISDIVTVFDSKQITDNQPLFWDTVTTGTGSAIYDITQAATVLSVSAAGDSVIRQTYRKFNYQPGKSQLIFMTGVIRNTGVFDTGITSYIGQFGASSGVFLQYDESNGIQSGIRKNTVDTLTPQASWNLDPMDGTGPSGITLDFTKTQIFVFNYEWLGVGSVWFGFVVGGALYWANRNDNSNDNTNVYMETPNNPFRYQIIATAAGSAAMTQICSSINSEGGDDPNGKVLSIGTIINVQVSNGDPNPEKILLALRYKDVSSSQIDIDIISSSVMCVTGVSDYHMYIIRIIRDVSTQLRNAANTGPPTLTFAPISNSALEVARPQDGVDEAFIVSDNLLGTSGIIISSVYNIGRSAVPTGPVQNSLRLGMSIAGVSDIITLSVYPFSGARDMLGGLTWREL